MVVGKWGRHFVHGAATPIINLLYISLVGVLTDTFMEMRNDDVIAAMKHKLEESYSLTGHHTLRNSILDFDVLAFIGRGSFGQVRLVRTKTHGTGRGHLLFALKNITKDAMNSKPRERIHAERDVLVRAKGSLAQNWLVEIHQAFQVLNDYGIYNRRRFKGFRTRRIFTCYLNFCQVGI